MANVFAFIHASLGWIGIGLFVAIVLVSREAQKADEKVKNRFKKLFWAPLLCFIAVAVMEFLDGKTSSATTWLIIGIANFLLYLNNNRKTLEV